MRRSDRSRFRLSALAFSLVAVGVLLWRFTDTLDRGIENGAGALPDVVASTLNAATGDPAPAGLKLSEDPAGLLRRDAATGAAAERTGAEAAPEEAQFPKLRGRVMTAPLFGVGPKPIAGAKLTYGPIDLDELDRDERATSTITDAHGQFELPIEVSGQYPLEFTAEGHLPHRVEMGPIRADLDLGAVVLAEASMVAGRVLDSAGHGIGGARILQVDPCADDLRAYRRGVADQELAVTDEDGLFEVPASARNGPAVLWTIAAVHEDYRRTVYQDELARGASEQRPITITMEQGAAISGRITGLTPDELKREGPLAIGVAPRAVYWCLEDDWDYDMSSRRVSVDPTGHFVVGGLREGESVAVAILTGGQAKSLDSRRRSTWTLARAGEHAVELPYLQPARIRARLLDASGQVVERGSLDADFEAQLWVAGEYQSLGAMIDLPGGAVEWICRVSDFEEPPILRAETEDDDGQLIAEWEAPCPPLAPGSQVDLGAVVLKPVDSSSSSADPRRTIEVQAVDIEGRPLRGTGLRCRTAGGEHARPWYGRTDGRGRATFEVPADTDHEVRVQPVDHRDWFAKHRSKGDPFREVAPWTRVPRGPGVATVKVTSAATADVEIAVTYAGTPLVGASLLLAWNPVDGNHFRERPDRDPTPQGRRTNGAGVWQQRGVLPGPWRAWVYHPQLRMPEQFDFHLVPGANAIALMRSSAVLEGRVVDEDGSPVAGAMVRPEFGSKSPLLSLHERDNYRMSPRIGSTKEEASLRDIRYVRTRSDGTFRLAGVQPNVPIKAVAFASGFILGASKPLTVEPDSSANLGDIELRRGGRLVVELPLGADGDVWIDPAFEVREEQAGLNDDYGGRWSSIFDSEVLDGVAPGEWKFMIEYTAGAGDDERRECHGTVTIRVGETSRVSLRDG